MRHSRSSLLGVTLIELIMTMVISAVLVAVAVPRLTSVGAVRLEAATSRLMADLRYAQRLAAGRQTGVAVNLSPAQERYRVYDFGSGVNVADPISGDPGILAQPWSSGLAVNCSTDPQLKGVNLMSDNFGDIVRFDSLGRPSSSAGILFTSPGFIQIEHQGYSRTIFIEPNTGRVWWSSF